MKITQLDKSIETIKKLDISEYSKVYFLILKTSKTKKGTDNYVFNSKRLDYLQFNEINIYMDNPNYMLVKIEDWASNGSFFFAKIAVSFMKTKALKGVKGAWTKWK